MPNDIEMKSEECESENENENGDYARKTKDWQFFFLKYKN